MHLAAHDAEDLMVLTDGFGIRCLEEAIHLSLGVVKELNLANTELVDLLALGVFGYLLDCLPGQFQASW